MSLSNALVCWLQQCRQDSVELVGGKCASLGELINAGIRVPPGFAITTHGYRQFIGDSRLAEDIASALDGLDERHKR